MKYTPTVENNLDFSLIEDVDWRSIEWEIHARNYIKAWAWNQSLSYKKKYKNPGIEIIKFQLLILQIFLRTCVIWWAIQSVLSEKTGYHQQVQHGAKFPIDLGNEVLQIGTLMKNTLSEIPDNASLFEKIWHHYQSTKELGSYITLQVQEILSWASNATKNISQAPIETIHAAIGVAAMYFILSEIIWIVRLWDTDTLMSRVRKRIWKTLMKKDINPDIEIITTFKNPDITQNEKLKIFEDLLKQYPIGS